MESAGWTSALTIGASVPGLGLREAGSKILQKLEELQSLLLPHSDKVSQICDSMAELQNTWSCTKFPEKAMAPPLQYSCLENPRAEEPGGCSPWGHEESDTTERLHFHFSLSCIREGNGNPLQCSCLENPRDRGAWWAAIYGVAQSWTRLKRLSSSSTKFQSIRVVSTSLLPCQSHVDSSCGKALPRTTQEEKFREK